MDRSRGRRPRVSGRLRSPGAGRRRDVPLRHRAWSAARRTCCLRGSGPRLDRHHQRRTMRRNGAGAGRPLQSQGRSETDPVRQRLQLSANRPQRFRHSHAAGQRSGSTHASAMDGWRGPARRCLAADRRGHPKGYARRSARVFGKRRRSAAAGGSGGRGHLDPRFRHALHDRDQPRHGTRQDPAARRVGRPAHRSRPVDGRDIPRRRAPDVRCARSGSAADRYRKCRSPARPAGGALRGGLARRRRAHRRGAPRILFGSAPGRRRAPD